MSMNSWSRAAAFRVYQRLVSNLHLERESPEAMLERLSVDRIEAGTVVS